MTITVNAPATANAGTDQIICWFIYCNIIRKYCYRR
jgi:hypothetical protein